MERKIALIVLDGFGLREEGHGNAIKLAQMPYFNSLKNNYSFTAIKTHGSFVGLPNNQFGNSEVGHLNLGSGRVVKQNSVKISDEIKSGEFFKNEKLLNLFEKLKNSNGILHTFGLCSNGGVHGDITHLISLIDFAKQCGVKNVYVHFLSDGRDTKRDIGEMFYNKLQDHLNKIKYGKIVSVTGRFYAMDREKNYGRTEKFLDVLLNYKAENTFEDLKNVFKESYKKEIYDEFIEPSILKGENFAIKENDGVLAFNFRSDRMKQIFQLLIENQIKNLYSFIQYDDDFNEVNVIFKEDSAENCLSDVLSKNNLTQLRISETTKFAHVTYFFNLLKETPFKNENRIIIKSDEIEVFADKPKMKAGEITDRVIEETNKNKYDFILINYPNCDMVGHSGNLNATITAVEFLDKCLEKLCENLKRKGYTILITADHGNADIMINEDGSVCTTHTTSDAPFIIIDKEIYKLRDDGKLADVSPTILDLFNIKPPKEFTEHSLIIK